MGRRIAKIVSGSGNDDDPRIIKRVDGVGPGLGGYPPHTQAHHMNARRIRIAKRMDVVEALRDRAVPEQDDPIGDTNRNDIGVGRAAEWLEPRDGRAGQDA